MFKPTGIEDIEHVCTFPHYMLPLVAHVYKEHWTLETLSEVGMTLIWTGICLSGFIFHPY
jgi:hypothetical protein